MSLKENTPARQSYSTEMSYLDFISGGGEAADDAAEGGGEPPVVGGGELKLINEGTYGCIYHPGINCQGRKENVNYLTKIIKNTKTVQNEIAISSLIRQIRGYTRHFAPIIKQCPVKIAKKQLDDVKQCELFAKESDTTILSKTYYSNKIRYVGDTNISKYILSQTLLPNFWKELLETHTYLLKGVQKLLTQDIVHHDVKYNNIMFDAKLGNPVFIDFGISIHIPTRNASNLPDAFYVFDTYPYWCFEVCVCNYIFREISPQKAQTAKITDVDLDLIIDVFIYGYDKKYSGGEAEVANGIFSSRVLPVNSHQLVSQFKQNIRQTFAGFMGQTWISFYDYLIANKVYATWDAYSLAVVYLFILEDYLKQHPDAFIKLTSATSSQYKQYVLLLHQMLFSGFDKRPSIQSVLKTIKGIMGSVSKVL